MSGDTSKSALELEQTFPSTQTENSREEQKEEREDRPHCARK